MKTSKRWHLVWQIALLSAVLAIVVFCMQKMGWKMSGDVDKVTAEQFATLYLNIPLYKLKGLNGWGTSSYSETAPTGYIFFDCDENPPLIDASSYEQGGDSIALTDKLLQQFGKNAWPLLRSSEVICMRMREGSTGPRRYFLHNRNSKRYFFVRI